MINKKRGKQQWNNMTRKELNSYSKDTISLLTTPDFLDHKYQTGVCVEIGFLAKANYVGKRPLRGK
jgi:hypothetical protein